MKVAEEYDEGRTTPFESGERAATERSLARGLLAIRSLQLAQAAVCMATGWKAYRRPRLALALLGASAAESAWLARRIWRAQAHSDPRLAWWDTGFGVAGLYVMAATTWPDDGTAWMNWMCPLTIGVATGASVAIESTSSRAVPATLAGVYLFTVRTSLRKGGSQLATALANATSYGGFYLAASVAAGKLRGDSAKLEQAREEMLKEREDAAAQRQRNKEHRLLHDSALQTLELVANNEGLDPQLIRRQARREAALLRRAISGEEQATTELMRGIEALAAVCADEGLRVELTVIDPTIDIRPDRADALLGAVKEALTNVAKHADVAHAVVNVTSDETGVRINVRDRGVGFDQSSATTGFGLQHSIADRLADVDGSATVTSTPGHGTKVVLWAPK